MKRKGFFMFNNISKTNTNFQGAFKINYSKELPGMREMFEKTVGNGMSVFENVGKEGDILYVIRNSKDYDVAQFMQKNELEFQYFPELDTKSDIKRLKDIKAHVENPKSAMIDTISKLMEFVGQNRAENRAVTPTKKPDYDKMLKNVFHSISGKKIRDSKGVVTLADRQTGELIKISPKSKFGINYVYHKPVLERDPIERYAVDAEGNILASFNTPQAIIKFDENFNKAIRHHLHKD